MLTENAMRTASHEAAHASLAVLLGLHVDYIARDRVNAGKTRTRFDRADPRTAKQMAADRAVIAIGAVLREPTLDASACDDDIARAEEYARLAGCSLAEAADRARELLATDECRRVHRLFEGELISRPYLNADAIEELLA